MCDSEAYILCPETGLSSCLLVVVEWPLPPNTPTALFYSPDPLFSMQVFQEGLQSFWGKWSRNRGGAWGPTGCEYFSSSSVMFTLYLHPSLLCGLRLPRCFWAQLLEFWFQPTFWCAAESDSLHPKCGEKHHRDLWGWRPHCAVGGKSGRYTLVLLEKKGPLIFLVFSGDDGLFKQCAF